MVRRDELKEYVSGSLWVLPSLGAIVALAAGVTLSFVRVGPGSLFAFQGTADDARALLSEITSTMVTVIALLLGLAVVALQLSSTQFSPRLLRNFLRDRPNQIVLAVFVATFAYSAGGLYTVGVAAGERSAEFPRFAVTVAIALLFVSLALLVFFADHLAHSIQVDTIMRVAERNTLKLIRSGLPADGATAPATPATAMTIPALRSGYVQAVNLHRLLSVATRHRVNVCLRPKVGEHVVAGTTLGWVWLSPAGEAMPEVDSFARHLDTAVRIGFERTLEQDIGFGLRQLVDIGCKALSSAINDPYTAIQAIQHLSVLFSALAARPLGDHVVRDAVSGVTVVVPDWRFHEWIAVGLGLLRRYGAKEPTVVQALLRLLNACAMLASDDPRRLSAIQKEAEILVADVQRSVVQPADLVIVEAEAKALQQVLADRRAHLGE
jgi:uncharacterized membrane protein